MNNFQVEDLLCQALETEIGGAQVYQHAIRCAQNEELKREWLGYLEQTRNHEKVLRNVFSRLGLDAEQETAGRRIVREQGRGLVQQIVMAMRDATPQAAQIVAAECVVAAETKDHHNWGLLGELAKAMKGDGGRALAEAHAVVEDEEDEHLYHTMGWARELWLDSLGLAAVIPPPEERRHVKSAVEAARAKAARGSAVGRGRS